MTSSIDRLSSLPDDVICHILSFLPTEISVATSILAKRYRFLWTYVPTLYFDSECHSETSFLDMISRVMSLTKALSINTFHISSHHEIDSRKFELEPWITTVVERNVQTLFLYFYNSEYHEECVLPLCIFSCKTLVHLVLGHCTFPSFSRGSINLPKLKSLKLYEINYVVDDALPCLLYCCPVLDDLFIHGDEVLGNFYNISSPSIQRLVISLTDDHSSQEDVIRYELKIHTPALKYLRVRGFSSLVISSCHMLTLLTEADIYYDCYLSVEDGDCFLKMISFLESLSNVRCLKLCRGPVFSNRVKLTTRFDNLTQLEYDGDWPFLMNLLESSENLEILIIKEDGIEYVYDNEEDVEMWMEPKQVPTCLLSRLRTVRFNEYMLGEQMVGYILRNARVLERIELQYSRFGVFDSEDIQDVLQRISMFERGSEACKVVFC